MPYVDAETRRRLDPALDALSAVLAGGGVRGGEGELNYAITRLLTAALGPAPRYADFNAAIGVLECAKLELYRRAAAPYEDEKRSEHGDVYGPPGREYRALSRR